MVEVPKDYEGREQSYLKHRVLHEYLVGWGMKLASAARTGRRSRLCYVDGFAGPWKARSEALEDTSIAISLRALETAVETWRARGAVFDVEAAFVEKDAAAFRDLQRYLEKRTGAVRAVPHEGEFGVHGPALERWLGTDPALIFVDPTGWKGAAMRFIAPLARGGRHRDVLVNVMFDHINRFKDDERGFLRSQMRDFFGLVDSDLPDSLGEEGLFALYRAKLKEACGLRFAADLAIPHPTRERTKFRLVVGGQDPAVIELFRDVEKKVVGREAAAVRDEAARRQEEERTGQTDLFRLFSSGVAPATDTHYESMHSRDLRCAPAELLNAVRAHPATFGELWPALLERLHLTKSELGTAAWKLYKEGLLAIPNARSRERTASDRHLLTVPE